MTLAQLTDDIMVSLGYVHDDALRSRIAVMGNVKMAVDKVRDQILTKAIKKGDDRSVSDMLSTYVVPVSYHENTTALDFDYRYFVLPVDLYSLPHDGGVAFIRYNRNTLPENCIPQLARVTFTGTTMASLSALYHSAYQSPGPSRPYYARDKDRVYVFGVDPAIKTVLVGLYAPLPDFETIDPDEPIKLPSESFSDVKRLVLEAERWVLQVPQQRLHNDGRDFEPNQAVRTEPVVSVNDPIRYNE